MKSQHGAFRCLMRCFNRRRDSRETYLDMDRVVSEREMREKLKKEKEEVN